MFSILHQLAPSDSRTNVLAAISKFAGSTFAAVVCYVSAAAAEVRLPPQFVSISFDNCREIDRWQDISQFTTRMRETGKKIALTFFISGVTLIPDAERRRYAGPNQAPGRSKIGFGGTVAEVATRAKLINELRALGHEVASHAVGHFDARLDGPAWTKQDWVKELTAFEAITVQGLTKGASSSDEAASTFGQPRLMGFRAPYLSVTPGMLPALASLGYRYDASGHGDPKAWPRKVEGVWKFDLARLLVAGTSKRTISMDYNFYVAQSGAREDREKSSRFKMQMVNSYLDYFRANYTGNRAPVHIGHHFQLFQSGVYYDAIKEFAEAVCGLPEVECAHYSALADFLDAADERTLAAFQKGDFEKPKQP